MYPHEVTDQRELTVNLREHCIEHTSPQQQTLNLSHDRNWLHK